MKPNKKISSIESRLTTKSLPAVAIQGQEAAHSYILELVKMLLLLASSLGLFSILLRMMNETISTETEESSALSVVSETDLSQFTWLIPITLGAIPKVFEF